MLTNVLLTWIACITFHVVRYRQIGQLGTVVADRIGWTWAGGVRADYE